MCKYITDHGGKVLFDTTVTNIVCDCTEDKKVAKKIEYTQGGVEKVIELTENDLVICTNGCQGDASAYGDNTHAPVVKVKNGEGPSVEMWKKLAAQDPAFGHPEKFFKDIKETSWESWTVDTANKQILDAIQKICKRDPLSGKVVTGGIVTCRDSSWLISWTINRQGQFQEQPKDHCLIWVYGLTAGTTRATSSRRTCATAPVSSWRQSGCITSVSPRIRSWIWPRTSATPRRA